MDVELYLEARRRILEYLHRKKKWGGAHTSVKYLSNQISRDKRGSKEVKTAIADLFRENKLVLKQTVEDNHVSLNPRFVKEIIAELQGNPML